MNLVINAYESDLRRTLDIADSLARYAAKSARDGDEERSAQLHAMADNLYRTASDIRSILDTLKEA